ncbi:hypothetical protein PS896_01086 [Pseudomonas fluorescens]|uniref:Uncharacterized protein n=1 Tax=Pseudomonas fluorescens TaxID=294 RepID=A0A5E7HQR7_PSEFL|nr:hypothetical protein PS896_01086 [Pseudomonas fluorescens]
MGHINLRMLRGGLALVEALASWAMLEGVEK